MGKHGPCYHCGVTSTPLWRNGPPDKPVLCNACGSRWRTKGTLANYTPLHAREEESKVSLDKYTSFKLKGHDTHKKKQNIVRIKAEFGRTNFDQNFQKGLDDDDLTSESSSGSAGSYSDSCAHFGDTSEATGSCQSNMWDTLVPSRRRSGATRSKPSPAEKLTKDLHSILHQQSSYLSASSDDLLYETGASMDAEIGHGVLLLKKSHSNTKAEESEASSFLIDNKSVQSGFPLSTHYKSKNPCVPGMEDKKYSNLKTPQGYPLREKPSQDKFHILLNKDSYLASINLKDIVNFDGYMRCLTSEERQHLVKYLPDTGTANLTESLRSMFSSTQFQEALPYFQHLLKEGIFDLSFPGLSTEECRKVRKAALTNLTKAKLIEQCNTLKEAIAKPFGKKGSNSNVSSLKRSQESLISSLSEPKVSMKCSKKLCKNKLEQLPMDFPSRRPHAGGKSIEGTAACKNEEFSCFSLTSLSAASSHKSCIMDNLGSADNNSDEELLLDVRSNTSFPEAELLSDHWSQRKFSESFCEGSGVSEKEGSLCCNSSVSFNSNRLKHG